MSSQNILARPESLFLFDMESNPTCIVGERSAILVKDKPAFLPGLDLAAHFDKKASAGFIGDGQMEAGVWVVSSRLDIAVKVKVVLSYRQVATQQTGLWEKRV